MNWSIRDAAGHSRYLDPPENELDPCRCCIHDPCNACQKMTTWHEDGCEDEDHALAAQELPLGIFCASCAKKLTCSSCGGTLPTGSEEDRHFTLCDPGCEGYEDLNEQAATLLGRGTRFSHLEE